MCYGRRMAMVASRELRNNTRGLLDRVAAGETLTITVDGRPVAVLNPVVQRRRSIPSDEFFAALDGAQADPGLTADLRDLLGDETTDDLVW